VRTSVLIPARNEPFLSKTVAEVQAKARGDVEIIVALDGYWPEEPLPDSVIQLHRGDAKGMRPNINAMCDIASGDFLMKLDAHCMVGEGFDVIMAESCPPDGIMVPRRYALDADNWRIDDSNKKYPIDAHYLSYPLLRPDDLTCGLHGEHWRERRDKRQTILIDDEMSSQGSSWFMSRGHWARLGDMDSKLYGNFVHEFQELGLKTWLRGGSVLVNKKTWYAHLYKGHKHGRGYTLGPNGHKNATKFVTRFWMEDRDPQATRTMQWLVEHFEEQSGPIPGWPRDWPEQVARFKRERKGPWATEKLAAAQG
jgi:glycosyltransferase involved in cell wall biosynthesis